MSTFNKRAPSAEAIARQLTMKERAKAQRKEAYQKAKAARAIDPAFLAMKQRAKEQRREAYRAAKERNKATAAEEKAKVSSAQDDERKERRASMDAALMQLIQRERAS